VGTITIANKHRLFCVGEDDFHIGRGSPLGNPYPITSTISRDEVIARYETWLKDAIKANDIKVLNELTNIAVKVMQADTNVRLICFCAPKRCHGEIIKQTVLDGLAEVERGKDGQP
jgi:hypothetical protein